MKPIKTLLLICTFTATSLWAGFTNIDCTNEGNLTVLQVTEGDCRAMEAFWDATGQGVGWTDTTGWNELPLRSVTQWSGQIDLHDDNSSVKYFYIYNKQIPGNIENVHFDLFTNLLGLGIDGNNLTGEFPKYLPSSLEALWLNNNHFTGSIPSSYADITNLHSLYLDNNNLSGPLPDLSGLTELTKFEIYHNQFTFADIEPQMGWAKNLENFYNVSHRGATESSYPESPFADPRSNCRDYYIDERGKEVFFDKVLRIEPSVPENPIINPNTNKNNDFFAWFKYTAADSEQDVTTDGSRIYTKENATPDDAGYYYYEANNSMVTLPRDYNSGTARLYYCSTPREYGIHAKHDYTPNINNINTTTPPAFATVDSRYTFSAEFNDTDVDDTLSVSLQTDATWLTLSTEINGNEGSFTLTGTPPSDAIGTHDINLTVTDGKIPVYLNYTLTVLPVGLSSTGSGFEHTTAGSILSELDTTPQGLWSDPLFYILPNDSCTDTSPIIGFDYNNNPVTLYTAMRTCSSGDDDPTLQTGNYPEGTTATLIDSTTLMVEVPLGTGTLTLGGN